MYKKCEKHNLHCDAPNNQTTYPRIFSYVNKTYYVMYKTLVYTYRTLNKVENRRNIVLQIQEKHEIEESNFINPTK